MTTSTATFTPESGLIDQVTFLRKISAVELPIVTNNKRESFYNVPCAFDIEVSSFYNGKNKQAFMYIWQFQIDDYTIIGRKWEDFFAMIGRIRNALEAYQIAEDLPTVPRLYCFDHNLAYEWQFLQGIYEY